MRYAQTMVFTTLLFFSLFTVVAEMRDDYWFWRASEGGQAEPFKSKSSAMPPWKNTLSVEDRWAAMAYQHTFSGHDGPHVPWEHPRSVVAVGRGAWRRPIRTDAEGQ